MKKTCYKLLKYISQRVNCIHMFCDLVGKIVDFRSYGDINIPAAILKSFFRQLPEPILTFDLYDHIIHVQCKLAA